jgi:DNA topoisomerase IB
MTQLERLQREGIRRRGSPLRGFHYQRADGHPVSRQERERIEALKLPPAWKDVGGDADLRVRAGAGPAAGEAGGGRGRTETGSGLC